MEEIQIKKEKEVKRWLIPPNLVVDCRLKIIMDGCTE